MNSADIQKFRKQLNDSKTELEHMEIASKESTKPVELDQTRVGRLSRMDAMQGQQMAKESARRRQQQLTLIRAALKRIEEDEYGYCLICDEEIDIRRLKVDPAITRCISCAE